MPQNNELSEDKVRPLIRQIFLEKPNYPFTKLHIQKILYKLKQNLSERYPDYPVFDVIPSYWYYEGPFSPPVNDAITAMVHSMELTARSNGRYKLADGAHFANKGLEPYIISELQSIVKPFNRPYFDKLGEDIYSDAPSEFMPLYKYRYLVPFRKLATRMRADPIHTDVLSQWEDALYTCERKVPRIAHFREFKTLFSSFVTEAVMVMDSARESWDYNLMKETYNVAGSIWKRFAEGIRIEDNAHDPPFTTELKSWRQIFDNRIKVLRFELDDFTSEVIEGVQFEEPIEYDEDTKQILSAVVKSYFSTEDFL